MPSHSFDGRVIFFIVNLLRTTCYQSWGLVRAVMWITLIRINQLSSIALWNFISNVCKNSRQNGGWNVHFYHCNYSTWWMPDVELMSLNPTYLWATVANVHFYHCNYSTWWMPDVELMSLNPTCLWATVANTPGLCHSKPTISNVTYAGCWVLQLLTTVLHTVHVSVSQLPVLRSLHFVAMYRYCHWRSLHCKNVV